MPKGVVEGENQERYWKECKKSVSKSHPDWDKDGDQFYEAVMGCFYRRINKTGGKSDFDYKSYKKAQT